MKRALLIAALLTLVACPLVACNGNGGHRQPDAIEGGDVPVDRGLVVEADVAAEASGGMEIAPDVEPGDRSTGPDWDAAKTIPQLDCPPLPPASLRLLSEAALEGALVPGEVLEADVSQPVLLPTPEGDEQFLLILYDLGSEMDTQHQYQVTVERGGFAGQSQPRATHSPALWKHLRPPATQVPGKPSPAPSWDPELGDIVTFQVPYGYIVVDVEAELRIASESLLIFDDLTTDNPLDPVDPATMETFAQLFEEIIIPRERFLWGHESDVNDDGRVSMLFSHLVNQSSAHAFVNHCDLLDPSVCGYGNGQELIYVAIPDPEEKIHTPEAFAELIAHEFNHSIYFAHKFLAHGATASEENVYITEGMSGLAQDLVGFNRGNLFVAMAALQGIDDVSLPDLHLHDPDHHYFAERDGSLRGASYLFLRYLFDQFGGEVMTDAGDLEPSCGSQFLRGWVDSPLTGRELAEAMTGAPYDQVVVNWLTAMVLSGRPYPDGSGKLPVAPLFSYLATTTDPVTGNQRGFDPWGNILGMVPLSGPTVRPADQADGQLRAGGVEYLSATPAGPGEMILLFDTGDAAAPGLRVVRTDAPSG